MLRYTYIACPVYAYIWYSCASPSVPTPEQPSYLRCLRCGDDATSLQYDLPYVSSGISHNGDDNDNDIRLWTGLSGVRLPPG